MSMFCYQCQEALKNEGCVKKGVCGKDEETASLQDALIHALKGLSLYARRARSAGMADDCGPLVTDALFVTVTNVNFDAPGIATWITRVLDARDGLRDRLAAAGIDVSDIRHDSALWTDDPTDFARHGAAWGVLSQPDPDIRSLRELLIYGIKGIAAYSHHARMLKKTDPAVDSFLQDALAATTDELSVNELIGMVMQAGSTAVTAMAMLDAAHTETYGHPQITTVQLGVRNHPGILISGHDLKDLEQLLEQTAGSGVDVYTHGEMLPAHYYPAFSKYTHLAGNYGGAWYEQKKEFAAFNGPILMTTNCIVPPSKDYLHRFFTTGVAGYPGAVHISADAAGRKNFGPLIALAKGCNPPTELESGTIVGGFAHAQVLALADKVVDAVKSGAISRFIVMGGCDGRQKEREYFTNVARRLPDNTVILTAGCAKFRYNKLPLGDIAGIPRVLDAGQCNDSYSLALIALKLKEVFGLDDINQLPIRFDIAWYEQKAVTVLLALLHLGVKGIRLGPTLPAFLSPGVTKVLVDNFDIRLIGDVVQDIEDMTGQPARAV